MSYKRGCSAGLIIGVILQIAIISLAILFFMALMGNLDMMRKKDVKKYLKEKYEMTGEKIEFTGYNEAASYDRSWLITPEDDDRPFCVYQSGHGWERVKLIDNREDIILVDLYNQYEGEKDTFYPVIMKLGMVEKVDSFEPGKYETAHILVEFCDIMEYRKCLKEMDSFMTYLSDHGMDSFKVQVSIKDSHNDSKGDNTKISSIQSLDENFIEQHMIYHAVTTGRWAWLSNIDQDVINEVCQKKSTPEGVPLTELLKNRRFN